MRRVHLRVNMYIEYRSKLIKIMAYIPHAPVTLKLLDVSTSRILRRLRGRAHRIDSTLCLFDAACQQNSDLPSATSLSRYELAAVSPPDFRLELPVTAAAATFFVDPQVRSYLIKSPSTTVPTASHQPSFPLLYLGQGT